jgi:hypothetical protein
MSPTYRSAAAAVALALLACGDARDGTQDTPTARTGAATPASAAQRDPSRGGPTTTELNLAQRDEFVRCAQRHDQLGMTVGFRDGRAVSLTDEGTGGGDFNTRVSVPRAIASMVEDGGQYVGLREGDGPDMDVFIYADSSVSDLIDEERGSKVGGAGGQNARGQWSHYTTLSVDEGAPEPPKRVREAISSCLRRAADVFASLSSAPR